MVGGLAAGQRTFQGKAAEGQCMCICASFGDGRPAAVREQHNAMQCSGVFQVLPEP